MACVCKNKYCIDILQTDRQTHMHTHTPTRTYTHAHTQKNYLVKVETHKLVHYSNKLPQSEQ